MSRHDLSFRLRTHISQKHPEDIDQKLDIFQSYIIKARKKYAYNLLQIGNADQTPLTFDLPVETTITHKGSSTVSIKTTGNE